MQETGAGGNSLHAQVRVRMRAHGRSNGRLREARRHEFEHAVRAYGADLYRYAYWLCRDRHTSEDVVQEAFARAWKAWGELRELAQAKSWLMTIVRNETMRFFAARRAELPAHELNEAELPALPSFEAGVEISEMLALLPLTYREPLLLQVLGGFSCAEIATMLGTSEGAVMTRLTRARQALRRQHEETAQKWKAA